MRCQSINKHWGEPPGLSPGPREATDTHERAAGPASEGSRQHGTGWRTYCLEGSSRPAPELLGRPVGWPVLIAFCTWKCSAELPERLLLGPSLYNVWHSLVHGKGQAPEKAGAAFASLCED